MQWDGPDSPHGDEAASLHSPFGTAREVDEAVPTAGADVTGSRQATEHAGTTFENLASASRTGETCVLPIGVQGSLTKGARELLRNRLRCGTSGRSIAAS